MTALGLYLKPSKLHYPEVKDPGHPRAVASLSAATIEGPPVFDLGLKNNISSSRWWKQNSTTVGHLIDGVLGRARKNTQKGGSIDISVGEKSRQSRDSRSAQDGGVPWVRKAEKSRGLYEKRPSTSRAVPTKHNTRKYCTRLEDLTSPPSRRASGHGLDGTSTRALFALSRHAIQQSRRAMSVFSMETCPKVLIASFIARTEEIDGLRRAARLLRRRTTSQSHDVRLKKPHLAVETGSVHCRYLCAVPWQTVCSLQGPAGWVGKGAPYPRAWEQKTAAESRELDLRDALGGSSLDSSLQGGTCLFQTANHRAELTLIRTTQTLGALWYFVCCRYQRLVTGKLDNAV